MADELSNLGGMALVFTLLRILERMLDYVLRQKREGNAGEMTKEYWEQRIRTVMESVMDRRNDKIRTIMEDVLRARRRND